MSPMLATASAVISLALVAYTIGAFSERRSGELKRSHLVLFWLGLICDSAGTGLMSIMAQNSGGAMSPLHPVTGFLAIALMLFHAAWATYVVFRGNEKTRRGFHTLSIGVWLVWLVPYFVGMLIGAAFAHNFGLAGSRPGLGAAALLEAFPRVGVGFALSPQAWGSVLKSCELSPKSPSAKAAVRLACAFRAPVGRRLFVVKKRSCAL